MLRLLLEDKQISLYKLEKKSSISHATLNDIYNEKTDINKCSTLLLFNMSKALNVNMNKLYSLLSYNDLFLITYSDEFDLFKSNVCHELATLKYKSFLKKHLTKNTVINYYNEEKIKESLYLLSMIDYLCLSHNIPLVKEYDNIRQQRLDKLYVSKSIYLLLKTKSIKISKLLKESINEFSKHNILEGDVYNIK